MSRTMSRAISRRHRDTIASYGDNALTWFFVGMLVIAVVAGLLGNVGAG
jgi:hypothetical protein